MLRTSRVFLLSLCVGVGAACDSAAPSRAAGAGPPGDSSASAPGTFSRSRLIAHWPLDGSGHDRITLHPLVVVGAAPVADRHGQEGGALWFDGVDDYLVRESTELLDFDLQGDSYTISVWVKAESGRIARLMEKWTEEGHVPYAYSLQTSTTGLNAVVYAAGTTTLVRADDLWDGAWHHVAVTFHAGSGRLRIYRNGEQADAAMAWIGGSTTNPAHFWVGRAAKPVESRYYRGALDEMRIYRRALSANEIAALAL